ncbi:MAG: glucosamine-6-phosphate deaminase [Planctomycetota bacterium]
MRVILTSDASHMGAVSAAIATNCLRKSLRDQARARIVVATGASQFEVLANLASQPDIDWSRVEGFHLDEYVGIAIDHQASFCGYLRSRFVEACQPAKFHYLHGDANPVETIAAVGSELQKAPIDLLLCGIGENGHLAFNDPPADLETQDPYLIVELDDQCRQQQVGECWFETLDDVPTHAMSMSINQILQAKNLICSVPDTRKAEAVRATLEDPISPSIPASVLRRCEQATLVIDEAAASRLSDSVRSTLQSP